MEDLWRENNIFYNILCFVITENEKLFDRSDAVLYWRTVFHGLGILHHAYIALFATSLPLMHHPNPDIRSLYDYRTAYLTGWNFVFQTVFLGLSLSHDILEWIDKQNTSLGTKIRYWKNVIYNGMVVPFTLFVTTMFWCVYAIDRELVFPKVYDEVVPWWFNHCVHTNITIMIIIETLLQARRRPTDVKMENILYWCIAFSYAVVYYSIYYFTRRWLYQVFGVMNWWQVCLYQLLIWGGSYVFYLLHFPVNRLVHGSEESAENEASNKEIEEVKDQNGVNGLDKPQNGTNGIDKVQNGANGIDNVQNGTNGIDKAQNGTNGIHKAQDGTDGDKVASLNGANGNSEKPVIRNGTENGKNDIDAKVITDLKVPPFSTKSWSLKYRSTRNQFENSHL